MKQKKNPLKLELKNEKKNKIEYWQPFRDCAFILQVLQTTRFITVTLTTNTGSACVPLGPGLKFGQLTTRSVVLWSVDSRRCRYGKRIRPNRGQRARVILAHPKSIHPSKMAKKALSFKILTQNA
jgi:hypothetical protein